MSDKKPLEEGVRRILLEVYTEKSEELLKKELLLQLFFEDSDEYPEKVSKIISDLKTVLLYLSENILCLSLEEIGRISREVDKKIKQEIGIIN